LDPAGKAASRLEARRRDSGVTHKPCATNGPDFESACAMRRTALSCCEPARQHGCTGCLPVSLISGKGRPRAPRRDRPLFLFQQGQNYIASAKSAPGSQLSHTTAHTPAVDMGAYGCDHCGSRTIHKLGPCRKAAHPAGLSTSGVQTRAERIWFALAPSGLLKQSGRASSEGDVR